jgi:hypothetical protein
MSFPLGPRPRNRPFRHNREDGVNSQFGRLLNHPVHLIAFQDGLGQKNGRSGRCGFFVLLKDTRDDLLLRNLCQLSAVPGLFFVHELNGFARLAPKNVPQMMGQVAAQDDPVILY